jgi:ribosome-associated heat shock protein Hsp15
MKTKDLSTSNTPETMRLDKWLWAARFFKTRQMAIDAINGGKVHVNHQRTKPGKNIAIGDQMTITKEPFAWDIQIIKLESQRRSAEIASDLYRETPESHERRQLAVEKRREERALGTPLDQRPNKRDRRMIHRFKRLEPEG